MTDNAPPQARADLAAESELVCRIQAGEKELFYELIRPYERRAYLTAYQVLQNQADAEEVAQEAILKSFRHIKTFRGEARFSTWLFSIVINEARKRRRRDRKNMFQSLDAAAEEDECSDYTPLFLSDWREVPSEVLERKEIRQEIATALATLPVNYRELLVLRDIQHLNIAETAETLGISKGTVKIRLWRARLKMRDILAPKLAGVLKKPRAFWKGIRPW